MAKLKPDAITAVDIEQFVREQSDFDFEMRVVAALNGLGFTCLHAATYKDPVSGKIRQFDIRATRTDNDRRLALAVECKNIRENSPLLLSALPRLNSEAFHEVIRTPQHAYWPRSFPVNGPQTPYLEGSMVGKRTNQVGRELGGSLSGDDAVTFDKLGQSLNSCFDLVREHAAVASRLVVAVVPVLVIPDGRLWQVEYEPDGSLKTSPHQVAQTTLFVNHSWNAGVPSAAPVTFRVSHIDLVTIGALHEWVASRLGPTGMFPTTG